MTNQLVVLGVGSTDWTGNRAPAGGTHTGTSVIQMLDGTQYTVAHSAAEVQQKRDRHATAPTLPAWVAFDQPSSPVPLILDVTQINTITNS